MTLPVHKPTPDCSRCAETLAVAEELAEALFAEITGAAEDGQAERALRGYEELRRGVDR